MPFALTTEINAEALSWDNLSKIVAYKTVQENCEILSLNIIFHALCTEQNSFMKFYLNLFEKIVTFWSYEPSQMLKILLYDFKFR